MDLTSLEANIWSKVPGYDSDESEDSDSDGAELSSRSEECLKDVVAVLGKSWTQENFVKFAPVQKRGSQGQSGPARSSSHTWLRPPRRQSCGKTGSFRIRHIDAPLVRKTLLHAGFQQTNDSDFTIQWSGPRLNDAAYQALDQSQKVNHFPGSTELTRKDRLWLHFQSMARSFGKLAFDFMPDHFVLPEQLDDFLVCYQNTKYMWIVKPSASSQGKGIFMLRDLEELPVDCPSVVSRYIDNPLLIQDLKFDLRVYVLVTSFDPLRAYMYREGLTRFASKPYSTKGEHAQDVYRHLTNYSINKNAPNYLENQELHADNVGHKWSFSALNKHLEHVGVDVDLMWSGIMDLAVKTLLSLEPVIAAKRSELKVPRTSCFEVYGFDVLVDENLKPWLLEINLSPSMQAYSPLDWHIKSSLLSDVFNLIGVPDLGRQQMDRSTIAPQGATANLVRCRSVDALSSEYSTCQRPGSAEKRCGSLDPAKASTQAGVASSRIAAARSIDTIGGFSKEPVVLDGLTEAQLQMLAHALAENKRRHNFVHLYPTRNTLERYWRITEARSNKCEDVHEASSACSLSPSQLLASVLFGPRPVRDLSLPRPLPMPDLPASPAQDPAAAATAATEKERYRLAMKAKLPPVPLGRQSSTQNELVEMLRKRLDGRRRYVLHPRGYPTSESSRPADLAGSYIGNVPGPNARASSSSPMRSPPPSKALMISTQMFSRNRNKDIEF
eukprot:TRINITY_DN29191_c0_g1_i1.p1 TRINITY_DN29191_c0_g1~~TRINITY_DN29191_c0_g1_i1.p1  ORF type:complete len:724 (+),score=91.83 TRINITY_DN29191_c0_g1_i1:147-2318(+)